MDGVNLEFEEEALEEIAIRAHKQKTGARGLRAIIENIMLDVMYKVPEEKDLSKCIITKEVITSNGEPKLIRKQSKLA